MDSALNGVMLLQSLLLILNDDISRSLQIHCRSDVSVVYLIRINLIDDVRLHEDIVFLRVIVYQSEFLQQFVFDVVLLVERQSILILENSEVLLVLVDEGLRLLKACIVIPKTRRHPVATQLIRNIGFLAPLYFQNKHLLGDLNFRYHCFYEENSLDQSHVHNYFEFLVQINNLFLLLQVPDIIPVVRFVDQGVVFLVVDEQEDVLRTGLAYKIGIFVSFCQVANRVHFLLFYFACLAVSVIDAVNVDLSLH